MRDSSQIISTLSRIASVLRAGGNANWARSIERFESNMLRDPEETCARVLSIFGGMGSFNDIVLQKDGKMLYQENEELAQLGTQLYDLCRGLVPEETITTRDQR
jgi:hypothetical protein